MGIRKILFSLEMRSGEKVHTLEELKEKFDTGRVLEYAGSGQLVRWLRDRKANDMADKIESLDHTSEEYARRVCEAILGEVNEGVLRQIEEAGAQKVKAEKDVAEEDSFTGTEYENSVKEVISPDLLVKGNQICVIEGNHLMVCNHSKSFFPCSFAEMDHSLVQEAGNAYYLCKSYLSTQGSQYFLHRINLMTQKEEEICEIGDSRLLGVRNHKLFYWTVPFGQDFEIMEMDLGTLQRRRHKIKTALRPYDFYMHEKRKYPCIDERGEHLYCRMELRKGIDVLACAVADIDLENDTISELISKEGNAYWNDSTSDACWGTGRSSFLVYDEISREWIGDNNGRIVLDSKCIYYDMDTGKLCRLDRLEDAIHSFAERPDHRVFKICCGEGRIYWLASIEESSMDGLRHVKEIKIMEYDIAAGISSQKAYLNCRHWAKDCASSLDIFVGNNYLYMYNYQHNLGMYNYCESWRFPLDTWKVERLVKNGSEYIYEQ
ncbi:MAG TPA: hypothetical protein DCZ91_02510 [Lachnospiraceae bacterium]|nr:hypothetical protein [Lachnospiraceae bacterium]